ASRLQTPPGVLQAPAEIGVLRGPHALVETADLLERRPSHKYVGGRRAWPIGMLEVGLLAEAAARGAVALGERVGAGGRDDFADQRPHVLRDLPREVRVE